MEEPQTRCSALHQSSLGQPGLASASRNGGTFPRLKRCWPSGRYDPSPAANWEGKGMPDDPTRPWHFIYLNITFFGT